MKKPVQLQYLELMDLRVSLTPVEKKHLYRERVGYEGAVQFEKIMREALAEVFTIEWELLSHLNFDWNTGRVEFDFLLVTEYWVHLFEVKNLLAEYTYENGIWMTNGKQLDRDYFTQLKRSTEIMRTTLRKINTNIPLKGNKLVLINKEDTVTFYDETFIDLVLKRWHIKKYLRILNNEPKDYNNRWDLKQLTTSILNSQSQEIPFEQIDLSNRKFRPGILCEKCHSDKISTSDRYHVECYSCGFCESKEKTFIRMICEFSVIFPDKKPIMINILELLGDSSLKTTLSNTLKKKFEVKRRGKHNEYYLPREIIEYAFPNLKTRYKDYYKKK